MQPKDSLLTFVKFEENLDWSKNLTYIFCQHQIIKDDSEWLRDWSSLTFQPSASWMKLFKNKHQKQVCPRLASCFLWAMCSPAGPPPPPPPPASTPFPRIKNPPQKKNRAQVFRSKTFVAFAAQIKTTKKTQNIFDYLPSPSDFRGSVCQHCRRVVSC